jgi:hypothetical protein
MIRSPPYGRSEGAVSCLGLESIQVVSKLTTFPGIVLQEEYSLPPVFSTTRQFLETGWGKRTDFGPYTCIYVCVCNVQLSLNTYRPHPEGDF